jgi:hypothetical protein
MGFSTDFDLRKRSLTSVGQGKYFRRVCERDGTFARRVEGGEQEDKQGNQAEMSLVLLRDEKAHATCEKCPRHLWEGEQQK